MDKKKSKRGQATAKLTKPRSKAMLLPLAPAQANEIALGYHLTLEALRNGVGSQYHIGSMAQVTYMAMLLSQHGDGVAKPDLFRDAEEAILRCREAGLETGCWAVDEEAYAFLAKILTRFDQQLAAVSVHELMMASKKLKEIFTAANVARSAEG
jgi:hypothetical protein